MKRWNTKWLQTFRRTTSSGQYLPAIDGLRFLAIMPVLIQHLSERLLHYTPLNANEWSANDYSVYVASRGTMGVFLFFAISGFILALPFAKYWSTTQRSSIDLKTYFLRRLTRLEPPYIIWMTVFFIILILKGTHPTTTLLSHYIFSLFYVHNLVYNDYSWINPVAWSLEVEVQFYLLAPLLTAPFFMIQNKTLRRLILIISIIGIISLQHILPFRIMPWKATLGGQLQHFLAGFLLTDLYLFDWKNKQVKTDRIWDVIGILSLIIMPFTWSGYYYKNLIFAAALLIVLIASFKGYYFNRFLQIPIIAIIGGMCYTIYLIHLPLMELLVQYSSKLYFTPYHSINLLLQTLLTLPIILLLSALFFKWLEKPFMNKDWIQTISFHHFKFNRMKRFFSIRNGGLFLLLFAVFSMKGQSSTTPIITQGESLLIRPLNDLIAEALQKSPILKIQDLKILKKRTENKVVRRKWADYLTLNGNYQYGNNFILDIVQTSTVIEGSTTDRSNIFYSLGAGVRIPIGDVWTRNLRVNMAAQELKIEQLTRAELETHIKDVVIKAYTQLQTSMNLLKIKTKEIENRKINLATAEKYFREGSMSLIEYNEAISSVIALEETLEIVKGDIMLQYWTLKELTDANTDEQPFDFFR